jgi:hypothetical protein
MQLVIKDLLPNFGRFPAQSSAGGVRHPNVRQTNNTVI